MPTNTARSAENCYRLPETSPESQKNAEQTVKDLTKLEQQQVKEQVKLKAQAEAFREARALQAYFTQKLNNAGFFDFRVRSLKNKPEAADAIDSFFDSLHDHISDFRAIPDQETGLKQIMQHF